MKHAAIAGAGIVGAACAAVLARDGWQVTVVEPGVTGGGATAAGMGHIVVMDDSEAQFALTHYSRCLWDEVSVKLPSQVEFEPCGTLWVAADEEEMMEVRRKQEFYGARGVRTQILSARELAEAEPNLRRGLEGALLVPGDIVLYAPCAARWLLEQSGAEVRTTAPATADITVIAAGTWSTELIPDLPVRPRKGHLAITDRYPGFVRHQLVELGYLKSAHGKARESVAFNVQPRATGQVLIGSSRQFGVTHKDVDALVLSRMLQRAVEYMPALSSLSVIRTWTGFRAATPDKLPLIGPCPGREDTYLATGHEGLGITTSLGTARLLADLLAGRQPAIDPRPYLPCAARFKSS